QRFSSELFSSALGRGRQYTLRLAGILQVATHLMTGKTGLPEAVGAEAIESAIAIVDCQSAPNFDPLSAPNIDPLIGWLWSGADGRAGQGCGAIRPAGAGCQIRFLKRQLSLPVSTISQ